MTDRQTVMTDWCQEVITVNLCGLETRLTAGRKLVRTGVEEGRQSAAKNLGRHSGNQSAHPLPQCLDPWLSWYATSHATVVWLLLGAEWSCEIIVYRETDLWFQVICTQNACYDRTEEPDEASLNRSQNKGRTEGRLTGSLRRVQVDTHHHALSHSLVLLASVFFHLIYSAFFLM